MKKILLSVIFILVLSFAFSLNVFAEGTYIDVGLFYGSSAKSSLTITNHEGSFNINSADVFDTVEYCSDGIISVDGKEYRGSIILKRDSNGLLTVINRVDIEDYIASVVSSEMSPSFNIEALKAQAVCARTYVLKNINKHSSRGFNVCASTDCQAYKGISGESDVTTQAARETAGVIMKYDGQIIEAVYSATTGGWTEDVRNVWGSDFPYLSAVEDDYESKSVYGSSWKKSLTVEKATEIMNNKGYELGTITGIEVLESTEHGVATKLVVTGTEGTKVFTREGCRLAFGSVTLSQAFTVTPEYENSSSVPVYAYGGSALPENVAVISASGTLNIRLNDVTLLGDTVRSYTSFSNGALTGFVFNGRGNGHLVGMSQNGANGMANAGFDYEEILKHYYKGIELDWI